MQDDLIKLLCLCAAITTSESHTCKRKIAAKVAPCELCVDGSINLLLFAQSLAQLSSNAPRALLDELKEIVSTTVLVQDEPGACAASMAYARAPIQTVNNDDCSMSSFSSSSSSHSSINEPPNEDWLGEADFVVLLSREAMAADLAPRVVAASTSQLLTQALGNVIRHQVKRSSYDARARAALKRAVRLLERCSSSSGSSNASSISISCSGAQSTALACVAWHELELVEQELASMQPELIRDGDQVWHMKRRTTSVCRRSRY